MKTLIFNGSPRKNGDTVHLLREFQSVLAGETMVVSSYYDGISPCVDCRYCWEHPGCCVQDGMQPVYRYLQTCDNVVLASPVYFSQLTGSLLGLLSRLQTYFAAGHFRGEDLNPKHKNGVLFLVGAEPGTEKRAETTANTLFKFLNARPTVAQVFSMNTDKIPAGEDREATAAVRAAAELLNRLCAGEKDTLHGL